MGVVVCIYLMTALGCWSAPPETVDRAQTYMPLPDRVVLTWNGDPSRSQAVSWRTDTTIVIAQAQLAVASAAPGRSVQKGFSDSSQTYKAVTTKLVTDLGTAHYHTLEFSGLMPNTLYTYRVGADEKPWSEWFHFRTASDAAEPFTFIYLGDAQNDLKEFWSRLVRGAFSKATNTRFIIHAGDLVNRANADAEWGEWFYAGNHEYTKDQAGDQHLSQYWRPQFAFPAHGPVGLEESVYYLDYQGVRFVVLNSNERLADQAAWLEKVLQENTQRWIIAVFHHPIFSSAKGQDNEVLRQAWMPILDRYQVDLVLQGHDHTYGRTGNVRSGVQVQGGDSGTVYAVSVSGPKMFAHSDHPLMRRVAEDIQLYQVVSVNGDTLRYSAYTATDELYDAFELHKQEGGGNTLVELGSGMPERRREVEEK
jgi:hypothetical protein